MAIKTPRGSDPNDPHNITDEDGRFRRQESGFRDKISKGGKYPPEKGRYALIAMAGCPWAHRTLIMRELKGLEDVIELVRVGIELTTDGWLFTDKYPDTLNGFKGTKDYYIKSDPNYSNRYTVPILWDKKTNTVVNNESSEIIVELNESFNEFLDAKHAKLDLYPAHLRSEIDELNKWVYDMFNNGVYKTGFAKTQAVYIEECTNVFKALDQMNKHLEGKTYLFGEQLTLADVRAYTTAARFDAAYVNAFRCNLRQLRDYPNVNRWLKNLYWNHKEFSGTTDFDMIKTGYFSKFGMHAIIPLGPVEPIEAL